MEKLNGITFVLGAVLMSLNLFYTVTFFRKKAALGGVQLLSLQSIMYTDFFAQSIFIFPFLTVFGISLFTGQGSDMLDQMTFGYALLIGGMVFYIINTLVQTMAKKVSTTKAF